MINRYILFIFAICFSILSLAEDTSNFDHSQLNKLLNKHVVNLPDNHTTQVDYSAILADITLLNAYLDSTTKVSSGTFDSWSTEDQLAFLINVYNAWTVKLVLNNYPQIQSIKDIGNLFQSPWEKTFIPLFGKNISLDDIEHSLIRGSGRYPDPRIHFAVNCASVGCPALRDEAYIGTRLESQLEDQTHRFLSDRTRNRLEGNKLKVSAIFKWYQEDFEKGWLGFHHLTDIFAKYADDLRLSPEQIIDLQSNNIDIDYLDYDWKLNRKQP